MLAAVLLLAPAAVEATPPERTLTVDPIELVAGRETPGKPELALIREGIEYRFASPENKAAFEKDPAKFEVVDGGACGRMGPLSGLGDARRFAVHDHRIFFFASDGCREGFLKDPAQHFEADDTMPFGSHERVLEGRATLDKLVGWAGGAERLRSLKSFRAAAARTVRQGDKDWNVTNEIRVVFPDRYFQKEAWNESWFSTRSGPDGGAMASSRGDERIAESRRRAFVRAMSRQPLVILKAYVDGSPKADCPGLVVIGDGTGMLGELPVEYVKVWLNGATSRLTVESATGRLCELSFRGRDGTVRVGESVRAYSNPLTVDGVTIPAVYRVLFNGKPLPAADGTIDSLELNAEAPAELLAIPAW